jgi:hypothetical protein
MISDTISTGDLDPADDFSSRTRSNAKRQAVEFGVEIGEYHGVVRVPRRVFQRLLSERPTPRAVRRSHMNGDI